MATGMDRRAFLPGGLKAERVKLVDDRVLIHTRAAGGTAACPWCGEVSRRVHSHYRRCLADLPAHGRQVRLVLNARRFRCQSSQCGTRIFVERFSPAIGGGKRYGTEICDLERRKIIDLLPDREPATVEAWPRAQPQSEVVARDRNGGYGGAVTRALAQAIQVADRWHLLENISAAFLAAV